MTLSSWVALFKMNSPSSRQNARNSLASLLKWYKLELDKIDVEFKKNLDVFSALFTVSVKTMLRQTELKTESSIGGCLNQFKGWKRQRSFQC